MHGAMHSSAHYPHAAVLQVARQYPAMISIAIAISISFTGSTAYLAAQSLAHHHH